MKCIWDWPEIHLRNPLLSWKTPTFQNCQTAQVKIARCISENCALLYFKNEVHQGQHFEIIEDGYYMALDLGGTHCRVILVRLKDGEPEEPFVEYYDVPEKVRLGPGVKVTKPSDFHY